MLENSIKSLRRSISVEAKENTNSDREYQLALSNIIDILSSSDIGAGGTEKTVMEKVKEMDQLLLEDFGSPQTNDEYPTEEKWFKEIVALRENYERRVLEYKKYTQPIVDVRI